MNGLNELKFQSYNLNNEVKTVLVCYTCTHKIRLQSSTKQGK